METSNEMADFQKFRTEIMSEMIDEGGISTILKTSRFYSKLDEYVRQLLKDSRLEGYND